jgi:predicted O-methyltransferase YrrM
VADTFFKAKSFLNYWLDAVDEHSLHSPFFFDLYTNVIKDVPLPYEPAEQLRKQLLVDQREIDVLDLGSGKHHQEKRFISEIAEKSLSPLYLAALYARIIKHFGCAQVVELGTSFGINTLYLAQPPAVRIHTFEGAPEIASVARLTFEFTGTKTIQLIEGNIHSTLPTWLNSVRKIDFALIDANHTFDATTQYFEWLLAKVHPQTVMVVDDIHYSAEMQKAWEKIRSHKLVYASADLYRCGLLFFDPSLNKQHVILQF